MSGLNIAKPTLAQRDFLRALRAGDSVRVHTYASRGTRHFVVHDRAGDPVYMTTRGWARRRHPVEMIEALERRGILTQTRTRPRPGEVRYCLTLRGRLTVAALGLL